MIRIENSFQACCGWTIFVSSEMESLFWNFFLSVHPPPLPDNTKHCKGICLLPKEIRLYSCFCINAHKFSQALRRRRMRLIWFHILEKISYGKMRPTPHRKWAWPYRPNGKHIFQKVYVTSIKMVHYFWHLFSSRTIIHLFHLTFLAQETTFSNVKILEQN